MSDFGGAINRAQAKILIADQRPRVFVEVAEFLGPSDQYNQYPTIDEGVARANWLVSNLPEQIAECRIRAGNYAPAVELVLDDFVTLSADEGAIIETFANVPHAITLNTYSNLRGLNLTLNGNRATKSCMFFNGANGWEGTIESCKFRQEGQRKAIFEFSDSEYPTGGFISRADIVDLTVGGIGTLILGSGIWTNLFMGCNFTQMGGTAKDIVTWVKGSITADQIIGLFYNCGFTNWSLGDFFNFDDAFIQVHCQGSFGAPFDLLTLIDAPDGTDQVLVTREDAIEQYSYPQPGRTKGTIGQALSTVKDHLALTDAEREILRSNLSIIATGTEFQLGVLPGEFEGQVVQNFINEQQIAILFGMVVENQLLQAKDVIDVDNFELYRPTPVTGTNTSVTANHLIDSGTQFQTVYDVQVGEIVKNTATLATAHVTAVADYDLTLSANIFPTSPIGYQIGEFTDEWIADDLVNTTASLIPNGGVDNSQYMSISFNANLSSGDTVEKTYETPQDWSTFDKVVISAFGSGASLSAPIQIVAIDDNGQTATWPFKFYPAGDWIEYELLLSDATVLTDFKWWAVEIVRFVVGTIAPGITGSWNFDNITVVTIGKFSGVTVDAIDPPLTGWTHTGGGTMSAITGSNPRQGTGYMQVATAYPISSFQVKRTWAGPPYASIVDADEVVRVHYRCRNVVNPGAFSKFTLVLKDENNNTLEIPAFGIGPPVPRTINSNVSEWTPFEWYLRDGSFVEPSPPFDITKIVEAELKLFGSVGMDLHIDWLEAGGIAYCLSTEYDFGETYNQIRAVCSFGGYDPYKSGSQRGQDEDLRVMISSNDTFKLSDFAAGKAIQIIPYEQDPAKGFGAWIDVAEHSPDPNKLTFKILARRLSLVAGLGIQFRFAP